MNHTGTGCDATVEEIGKVLLDSLGIDLSGGEAVELDRLHEVVAMDSVALLEFVVAIEKRFGVSLGPEWLELERLGNLPALAAHIRQLPTSGAA